MIWKHDLYTVVAKIQQVGEYSQVLNVKLTYNSQNPKVHTYNIWYITSSSLSSQLIN